MLTRLFLFTVCILMTGCADTRKQDGKISSLETEVKQIRAELEQVKQQQEAAPKHHYELRTQGVRTFRFDPATGETCIQLTSNDDWKRKETKRQSCDCVDALKELNRMFTSPNPVEQGYADSYNKSVVDKLCP